MTPMNSPEKELAILEEIQSRQEVHQREIARHTGLSLGMTNAILKRLAKKGYITIRKVNNRNISYAVSPAGIDEIARRSYRYLKRTLKNVQSYRDGLEDVILGARDEGYRGIQLVGRSDLAFLVEYLAGHHRMEYRRVPAGGSESRAGDGGVPERDGYFLLYSEEVEPELSAEGDLPRGAAWIREILLELNHRKEEP
ncbi:MAG: winged helix-turn-helix transcriptional regulator [Spirochaetales bacterium]|nr:winged helix-turn-helix transcriptional regulator [Spirochaetales bacterium]